MSNIVYQLKAVESQEREAILKHMENLSENDRHLRFGCTVSNEALAQYVNGLNFNKDIAIGVYSPENIMVGFAHGATYSEKGYPVTELGLSVEGVLQGQGWGTKLIDAVMERAKKMGSTKLIVQTLTHNHALRNILKKKGGAGVINGTELEAKFDLVPRDEWSHMFHYKEGEVEVIEKMVDKSQPTVLCIHGAGGDAWQWRWRVMPELAKHHINSVALSLPCHNPTAENFKNHLDLIQSWHQRTGDKTILVAHSMGGFLAQHHLANTGSNSPTVLLASLPPFDVSSMGGEHDLLENIEDKLKCDVARAHLRNVLSTAPTVNTQKVRAPMTWIAGEKDEVVPLPWQRTAAYHYRAPLHVVDGGHNLMVGKSYRKVVDLIQTQAGSIV